MIAGVLGFAVATALIAALLLVVLSTAARPGGIPMTDRRRIRLIIGGACLVLAAIVGLIGYLRLSTEPDVNRQVPYLASAGMAVVVLAVAGGAFIVGEQMRTDEQRIHELEEAVKLLAAAVREQVEAPPRTRARGRSTRAS